MVGELACEKGIVSSVVLVVLPYSKLICPHSKSTGAIQLCIHVSLLLVLLFTRNKEGRRERESERGKGRGRGREGERERGKGKGRGRRRGRGQSAFNCCLFLFVE